MTEEQVVKPIGKKWCCINVKRRLEKTTPLREEEEEDKEDKEEDHVTLFFGERKSCLEHVPHTQ